MFSGAPSPICLNYLCITLMAVKLFWGQYCLWRCPSSYSPQISYFLFSWSLSKKAEFVKIPKENLCAMFMSVWEFTFRLINAITLQRTELLRNSNFIRLLFRLNFLKLVSDIETLLSNLSYWRTLARFLNCYIYFRYWYVHEEGTLMFACNKITQSPTLQMKWCLPDLIRPKD